MKKNVASKRKQEEDNTKQRSVHPRKTMLYNLFAVMGVSALGLASCGNQSDSKSRSTLMDHSSKSSSDASPSDDRPVMTVEDVVEAFENVETLEDQSVSAEEMAMREASLVVDDKLKPADLELSGDFVDLSLDDISTDQREIIDLRSNDTGIRNQGSEGTCTAFATVASMENLLKRFYGQSVDLSERHHWSTYANYQTTTSLSRAQSTPIVTEALWPYRGARQGSITGKGVAKINSYKTTKLSLQPVVESLRKGEPVVIAVGVLSSMMNPKQGGIITGGYQKPGAGHALAVTGAIIDSRVPGGGYFIVKNSWGSSWGDKGYGYASFDYCQKTWCSAYSVGDVALIDQGVEVQKPSNSQPSTPEKPSTPTNPSVTPSQPPKVLEITASDFSIKGHPSNRRGILGMTSYYLSIQASQDVLKQIKAIYYPNSGRYYTVSNGSASDITVDPSNLNSPDFRTRARSVQTGDVVVQLRDGKKISISGISFGL